MKKIFTITLIIILVMNISLEANAAKYRMKNANLKMPNLYSYTNAKKMKAGTYKYFGVQVGDIKSKVNKMWGAS